MGLTHLPLAHSALDRAANRRSEPRLIEELLGDKSTQILPIYDREVPIIENSEISDAAGSDAPGVSGEQRLGAAPRLHMIAPAQVPSFLRNHEETMWVYLGQVGGKDIIALILPTSVGEIATRTWRGQFEWAPLRIFAEASLEREEYEQTEERAGLAVVAVALANWHSTSRFCGRCGSLTDITAAGWSRTCRSCKVEHYPRTDAAVIMAVLSEDNEILLGNSSKWGPDRFSTLAGFVEPGETLEDAVRREVHEEAGIVIGEVTYLASQPWPFPGSLMLGYFAYATSHDITVDGEEIRSARWFTKEQLATEVDSGRVQLPGVSSIARRLIEHWYGQALNPPSDW